MKTSRYTTEWSTTDIAKWYPPFKSIVNRVDSLIIEQIAKEINSNNSLPNPFSVLDIGAGDGVSAFHLMKNLNESRVVRYDWLDVSEDQKRAFHEKISSIPRFVQINAEFLANWEEFNPEHVYNILILCHCLYGISGGHALHKIPTTLEANGVAYIVLSSQKHLSEIGFRHEDQHMYSAEDFMADLDRLEIMYTATKFFAPNTDRSFFLEGSKLTKEGIVFFSYLLRRAVTEEDHKRLVTTLSQLEDECFAMPTYLITIRASEQ